MSNKIGRFEILSELHHSDNSIVFKATDPESGQTVALKTIQLAPLGEQAATLVQTLLTESEASKSLNSHNVAVLYGAGEMDGRFCASLEYVQGNSVATMLARKEGFSIWDLQDIARQSCQGLDHAHAKNIFHYTLEPAKVMVSWDGTVKILGYGISAMGAFAAQASGKPPQTLHYMSPEQLRGDPLDARSSFFSLGAILYEMVTERKAFDGKDADEVRQAILEGMPVALSHVKGKVHPVLSEVIMKALSKAPEDRYQSGQELVMDLERCKESPAKAAAKKSAPTPAVAPGSAAKTAGRQDSAQPSRRAEITTEDAPVAAPPKKAAAAAGAGSSAVSSTPAKPRPTPQSTTSSAEVSAEISTEAPLMSYADTLEPEVKAPKITIDPMMDENRKTGDAQGRSFSEIDELPPLKEIYVEPSPPPPPEPVEQPAAQARVHAAVFKRAEPEKPRIKPGEVAKKAISEVKQTPPKLFLYSIGGAVAVILLLIGGIAWHIRSTNQDNDTGGVQALGSATAVSTPPAAAAAPAQNQAPPPVQAAPETTPAETPDISVTAKHNAKSKKAKPARPPAPAIIPGQLTVNSTPAGAQIQVDGQNNPGWVTPYNLPGLVPGSHIVVITKPGFAPETRTLEVNSGSKSFLQVQLASLSAAVAISSDPAGAAIWMDGKDTGKLTPAQISVDKPGNHSFVFKKQGYLDEATTANLQTGQTFRLAPTLKALGNTDEIKIGGKFKKMLGGGDVAGMGAVSIKTHPKGAQIAVNNRMLDKFSPVEFYLNPGTYVIDITLSGFKNIHRVINVEKNGKTAIDESMDRE
jgi:eukaryotic-like serine/threonine-protein kinase